MATNRDNLQTLTSEQSQDLIGWISEVHGLTLSREQFAETLLDALEDVSGFEAMTPSLANQLVHQLWSIYRGKENDRS